MFSHYQKKQNFLSPSRPRANEKFGTKSSLLITMGALPFLLSICNLRAQRRTAVQKSKLETSLQNGEKEERSWSGQLRRWSDQAPALLALAFEGADQLALRRDGIEVHVEAPQAGHVLEYFVRLLVQRAAVELRMA